MSLPGVTVTSRTTPPSRSSATDTGPAFLAGLFQKGPEVSGPHRSLDELLAARGGRQTYSVDIDWAETYFREGGNALTTARVLGPAAAKASANIAGTSGTTLIVTAVDEGEWANGAAGGLKYQIVNGPSGGTHRVIVISLNGVEVERSSEFNDRLAAPDLFASSDYVRVTLGGGSGLPTVVGATNLTGGADDRASITQSDVDDALAALDPELGPGQVVSPNWTTEAAHESLLNHAAAYQGLRFAPLDPSDTTNAATLEAAADALRGHVNGSYGLLLGPWGIMPGTAIGTSGRSVPPSALYCAKAAETDAADSANQAPAGEFGVARFLTGVKATFSRLPGGDAETLNAAGVNLIIEKNGSIRVYGNRTLVDPDGAEKNWLQASNARYRMSLIARARKIAEPYVFKKVTRSTIIGFENALVAELTRDYINGDLFGDLDDDRAETAFNVDTTTVNDATTIQNGELNASVTVRPTRGAEMVQITITATALTEPVA